MRRGTGRNLGFQIALVVVMSVLGFLAPRYINLVAVAETWAYDLRTTFFNPPATPRSEIVILTITEDTLRAFPYRSPVDRGFLADVLAHVDSAMPKAVGLDMLFDQPTEPDKDRRLRQTLLDMAAPVVVGWTDRRTGLTEAQYAFQQAFLDGIEAGYSNLIRDPVDGTVRKLFPGKRTEQGFHPSFSVKLAANSDSALPTAPVRMVYYGQPDSGTPAFPRFPIHTARLLPKDWFAGKFVLIGADLPFEDRHRTPFAAGKGIGAGSMPGVVIQAHMLAQILDGKIKDPYTLPVEIASLLVLGILATLLTAAGMSVTLKLVLGLLVVLSFWALCLWLYAEGGQEIVPPMVSPALTFFLIGGLGNAWAAREQHRQARFIQGAFSHYVAPAVVHDLMKQPDKLYLGGEKREVTLLFSDIEGFTSLSENLEPTVLVSMLNDYLDALSSTVMSHGGLIDKYIGDAVMAIFGAPEDQEDHAQRAVTCALRMQELAGAFAAHQHPSGRPFGRTRIGLHTGEAIVGNIGGSQRFDYTAIGDVVNTASRLEGVNKYTGTEICISQATFDRVHDIMMRPMGTLVVKGRSEGIGTFEPVKRGYEPLARSYNEVFELLRSHDPGAEAALEAHLEAYSNDRLARFHMDRLRAGAWPDAIKLEGK